jgi:hypothetical protein
VSKLNKAVSNYVYGIRTWTSRAPNRNVIILTVIHYLKLFNYNTFCYYRRISYSFSKSSLSKRLPNKHSVIYFPIRATCSAHRRFFPNGINYCLWCYRFYISQLVMSLRSCLLQYISPSQVEWLCSRTIQHSGQMWWIIRALPIEEKPTESSTMSFCRSRSSGSWCHVVL